MKFNKTFWIAFAVLIVWLLLAWFLGTWMGIKPPILWYLRIGLMVLGVAGFVGFLLLRPNEQDASPVGEAAVHAAREIDFNFTEASKRIQAATGNKQLNSLPAVFVLGDVGSAKTSILTQSGIEPELLAGQALQAGVVVPTASVNLWYARNTLFIDPSGSVVADPGARRKLFKKFLPVQLNSLLAAKTPPTRSVLLTMDCETFLQAGGPNALAATARDYQNILSELSRELGSSFPVYVLFTKADKIPYFRDFVENLNEAEVAEMMGLSLPIPPSGLQGSYAEKQSLRLNNAFQTLYYSLADKRPVYLARERTASNLSNIYEFPREFGKFRALLVQFLTDLCRPSQLGTSPFLRGFYFSGVRPVVINDIVPVSQLPIEEDAGFDSGATRMFSRQVRSAPTPEGRSGGTRKIPQWVFLRNLFPGVLLADRVGTTAAQVNVKVNFVRRVALACVAGLALAMASWWTLSYLNNSRLASEAKAAADAVPPNGLVSGQLASLDSLQKLSNVRKTLAVLNGYERDGAPWSYSAFLYKGRAIRQPLRAIYYALFRRLLLQPTQQTLIEISKNPGADKALSRYEYVYNALKAYLITTQYHDKRWSNFANILEEQWKKEQPVSAEQEAQARSNFAFYADELPDEKLYLPPSVPDASALKEAREFLNSFPLEESIYRNMLDSAAGKSKSIIFNRDWPETADSVFNKFEVAPWFTKSAYINFQNQLKEKGNLGGDDWVLGDATKQNVDYAAMREDLRDRYFKDYIKTWREFLAKTSENVPYGDSTTKAATVLGKLSGPKSSLMRLFCVASENTNVTKEVAQAFQPVQFLAPQGCDRQVVSQTAGPYVAGLAGLANTLQGLGPNPPDPLILAAKASVTAALGPEASLVQAFQSDPSDKNDTVLTKSGSLLRDPIEYVNPVLDGQAGKKINAEAGATCASINPLFHKYPFTPTSNQDATLAEVNEALNPQSGKLWQFVNSPAMLPLLEKAGSQYQPKAGQAVNVSPSFLNFVNRAALMTQAMYHGEATASPSMTFNIRILPSPDVDHVTLSIDGTTLSADPKSGTSQSFPWPGSAQDFTLLAKFLGSTGDFPIEHRTGLWAVWHALERAEHETGSSLQWTLATQGVGPTIVNGHPLTVKFGLDQATGQILQAHFFSGLSCPSAAVH